MNDPATKKDVQAALEIAAGVVALKAELAAAKEREAKLREELDVERQRTAGAGQRARLIFEAKEKLREKIERLTAHPMMVCSHHDIDQKDDEIARLRAVVERLREALRASEEIPELNLYNFTIDDVARLQEKVVEVWKRQQAAVAESADALGNAFNVKIETDSTMKPGEWKLVQKPSGGEGK